MSKNTFDTTLLEKPTYFEIFKKVLNELSFREVSSFDAIEKSEHKRILNLINLTNSEVLSSYIWDFQIEEAQITISKNCATIMNEFDGKIVSVYEENRKYTYVHPALVCPKTSSKSTIYSNIGPLILTTPTKYDRKLTIRYVSNNFALNRNGQKKPIMQFADDTSIIPAPYAESVLLYGTLIKVKANPSFAKFGYWRTVFYNTLNTMRSIGSISAEGSPQIRLGY